jgi:hypothetical protein
MHINLQRGVLLMMIKKKKKESAKEMEGSGEKA